MPDENYIASAVAGCLIAAVSVTATGVAQAQHAGHYQQSWGDWSSRALGSDNGRYFDNYRNYVTPVVDWSGSYSDWTYGDPNDVWIDWPDEDAWADDDLGSDADAWSDDDDYWWVDWSGDDYPDVTGDDTPGTSDDDVPAAPDTPVDDTPDTDEPTTPGDDLACARAPTAAPADAIDYMTLSELDRTMFKKIDQLYRVACSNPKLMWDDSFRIDRKPTLLVHRDKDNKNTHGYLLNHPKAADLPTAKRVATGANKILPAVWRVDELPGSVSAEQVPNFDFGQVINGTATYVMAYRDTVDDDFTSPESEGWIGFLAHEGFHDEQGRSWALRPDAVQDIDNYPLAAADIAAILLETRLLIDGLKAKDEDAVRAALSGFVSVRSARMRTSSIIENMDGEQERAEGTARYLEVLLNKVIPNETLSDTAELLGFDLGLSTKREAYAFDRFYGTGAALGLMLDRLGVSWKAKVESGMTQYEVIADALALRNDESRKQAILEATRKAYDYPKLLRDAAIIAAQVDDAADDSSAD